jgi:hypothetical protein
MNTLSKKSQEIIEVFDKNPDANVKEVCKNFNTAIAYVYKLRAKSREKLAEKLTPMPPMPPLTLTLPKTESTLSVGAVLDQRGVDYGQFKHGAELMQSMKRLVSDHAQKHGKTFADDQWEALEMIIHKIGRIVNGNPDKVDHWIDIAGYAKLVAMRLEGRAV